MERARQLEEEPANELPEASSAEEVRNDDEGDDAGSKMGKLIRSFIESLKKVNSVCSRSCRRVHSAKEAYDELVAIGVEPHLLMDYYIYLVGDYTRIEFLFAFSPERRNEVMEIMIRNKYKF